MTVIGSHVKLGSATLPVVRMFDIISENSYRPELNNLRNVLK
jgi:hypothetical protein